ncbi:MAG: hypothetical protein V4484_23665 [Pseudomonadota bacterium]
MLGKLWDSIDSLRAMRVRYGSRYWNATADVPATLYPYWKRTAQLEFKGIPQDAFFFARATEGLLTFFQCVRISGKPCALPSAAADSVWHAWARLAPQSLDAFCIKHFGKVIPHVEAEAMAAQMAGALATCMVTARGLEGRNPVRVSVPGLFALDRKLRMPGGYGYQLDKGEVAFRRLDGQGAPEGEMHHPQGLIAAQLLATGVITQAAYDASIKKPQDGGACGSGCASACDGGGGAACGSSCGSGCGGGCGGS